MKKNKLHRIRILAVAVLVLALGALSSCFEAGTETTAKATKERSAQTEAVTTKAQTCNLVFSYNGEELNRYELDYGTKVGDVPFELEETEEATFTFLGWDANGDGVAETFPFIIKEDTYLSAIVEKVYKTYHYTITNKGETLRSIDCHYGDVIDYPTIQSSIDGETVNLFLGWKVNGTYDGTYPVNCVANLTIEAYYAESQIVKAYAGGRLFADYVTEGNVIDISAYGLTPSQGHKYVWYLDSAYTTPVTSFVMVKGNLTLYGREEPETLTGETVRSADEIVSIFNMMQLNHETTRSLVVDYNYGTVNDIVNYIGNHADILYNYKISASLDVTQLTLTVEYEQIGGKTSTEREYTFVTSANLTKPTTKRSASYNAFASDKRTTSFTVKTSDALAYALENGYRPDITDTSVRDLYNKMKAFLREYVTDDMTDIEKARAIYEGLIEITRYDSAVLTMVKNGNKGLSAYNCFYLEGVFNDGLAVCDGIAKAYSALCNMEGIECVRITGKTVGSNVSHAWNKVKLGGTWYVVDATAGGCITKQTQVLTYAWFMLSDSDYASHAVSDGTKHTDIVCNTTYDIYSELTYAGNSLKVTTTTQGADLLRTFYNSLSAGQTATLDLSFAIPGKTSEQALNAVLGEVGMSMSVTYLENLNSTTIQVSK